MRIGLVSPYSWSFQGGVNRHVEALAEEFLGRGHDVRVLAPVDPPGALSRATHRSMPEPRELPGLRDAARPHDRLRCKRRRLQPVGDPGERLRPPAPGGPGGRIRRHPRARAACPAGRLERGAGREDAGRRHLPRLLDQADAQLHRQRPRRAPHVQPPLRPDRGLRGGRLDRRTLVRRRVHDRPQRRRHRGGAGRAEEARGGAEDPLRRPPRGAQGPASPAERLQRAGRARAFEADRDRRRRGGRQALARQPRPARLDGRPRPRLRGGAVGADGLPPTCSARRRSPARASAWC